MDARTFATAWGPVPLWADFDALSADRPLVLMVRGAFARFDHVAYLPERLPAADFVLAHMPGMHGPFLRDHSVRTFSAALDQIIAETFADRRIIALGLSIGALTTLGLRSPQVRAVIAVEPPLTTRTLWPMHDWLRGRIAAEPRFAEWIAEVFGVTATDMVNRDYRPLFDGIDVPVTVVLGQEPLDPPRPLTALPSLLGEADRQFLRRRPGVRLVYVQGVGHGVPRNITAMVRIVGGALDELAGAVAP